MHCFHHTHTPSLHGQVKIEKFIVNETVLCSIKTRTKERSKKRNVKKTNQKTKTTWTVRERGVSRRESFFKLGTGKGEKK